MMSKKIYEDVLDDLDEIRPDDVSEESSPAYVTEMFDTKPYKFMFALRVPNFMNMVHPDRRKSTADAIASFITEVFTDVSLQTETSPIYASGNSIEFGNIPFSGPKCIGGPKRIGGVELTFAFGMKFGRDLTVRQCVRLFSRINAVSSFVRNKCGVFSGVRYYNPLTVYQRSDNSLYVIRATVATDSLTIREYLTDADISKRFPRMMRFALRYIPTRYKSKEEIIDEIKKLDNRDVPTS